MTWGAHIFHVNEIISAHSLLFIEAPLTNIPYGESGTFISPKSIMMFRYEYGWMSKLTHSYRESVMSRGWADGNSISLMMVLNIFSCSDDGEKERKLMPILQTSSLQVSASRGPAPARRREGGQQPSLWTNERPGEAVVTNRRPSRGQVTGSGADQTWH